jgi:hypothetical protein
LNINIHESIKFTNLLGNLKYFDENRLNPNTRKLKLSEKIGSKIIANKTK